MTKSDKHTCIISSHLVKDVETENRFDLTNIHSAR